MNFDRLTRRELQALCKKNSVPANKSNVAMAKALHELYAAGALEIDDDFRPASPFFFTRKAEAIAPPLPLGAPARRPATPPSVDSREQLWSPRRRALRITASSYPGPVGRGESDDENEATSRATPMSPSAPSVSNPQGSATGRIARRSACKKEDHCDDGGHAEPSKTPATRNARGWTVRRGVAEPLAVVEKKKDTDAPSKVTSRRTIKSSKQTTAADALTASTARAAAMKMESLTEEEAHVNKVQEGIETKHSLKRNLVAEHNSVLAPYHVEAKRFDFERDIKTLVQEQRVKKADNVSHLFPLDLRLTIGDETDDKIPRIETFEEHCSAVIEEYILQQQQIIAKKEKGTVQEAARLNGEGVPDDEESSHGGNEANQMENELLSGLERKRPDKEESNHGGKEPNQMEVVLSGLQGSPVIGLVSSLEKQEPAKDDMIEQKLEVKASGEHRTLLTMKVGIEGDTDEAIEPDVKVADFCPIQQTTEESPISQVSNSVVPSESIEKDRDSEAAPAEVKAGGRLAPGLWGNVFMKKV